MDVCAATSARAWDTRLSVQAIMERENRMSEFLIRGSGHHYPEIVRIIKTISDSTVEVKRIGDLVNGAPRYEVAQPGGTKYVLKIDLEPYR